MSLKIGNVLIKNKVILAPMAGYTNEAFFYVVYKYGAGLLCSEMVSDKGLIYGSDNTFKLLRFDPNIRPFAIQIFGSNPKEMAEAAKIVEKEAHPDIIDINMGCSVPKIFKNGSGSALLKDPNKVYEICKEVVDAVSTPVTVKIRSGITHDSINCLEVAKAAELAGCSAISLHPRTKSDLFSGSADWSLIKLLKDNLKIPVIGSGDVKTPEDAKRMLDETGCDAVMIGRAALGNPFIFKQINDYLETGNYDPVSNELKFETMLDHLDYLINLKGEKIAVLEMRTQSAWYVKGMKGATFFKKRLNDCYKKEELVSLILEFRKEICGF